MISSTFEINYKNDIVNIRNKLPSPFEINYKNDPSTFDINYKNDIINIRNKLQKWYCQHSK